MLFIVGLALLLCAKAFQMEIPVNGFRCVTEEVFEGQVVHGIYGLAPGAQLNGRQLEFKVFDDEGEELLVSEIKEGETKNKYALTPDNDGDLDFCFVDTTAMGSKVPLMVTLDITVGFNDKQQTPLAGKDKISHTEEMVDDAHKSAYYIIEYLQECQKIEYHRRDINEATNSRTMWFSILTMIIVVLLTLFQVNSLKNFFLRRKLI
ncbi:transmembrane emp24 domain containing protein 10 precursor, putative [Entamoeba invadens IP1]|uniref:Transmembrane emp24 domain containing protein 10, putative n=1 Tax=Entamoeba invadens IP1 TaxID=370355 RepID=A0A0A1UGV8_ENTIV|nr:transmembrane emp24 domain containing protein 10 precursor, putative [Entamoeba invadens IP1]ELP95204.1 transmembrane emp24 domain containing protein 10 precursor, putative [Entamoeba invadens IP1]|eukprot:XP_004261975.1 transmembrane emp24 domain containing protein 10 precursor, putative [Entamoeba invadens IP1]